MSSWEGSACYPRVPLSFERWPFHAEPPDHYALVSYLIDLLSLPVKRPYAITLYRRLPNRREAPLEASVTRFGGDHP